MTKMLTSINSVEEALLVLQYGADLIDLKQPAQGALGALPLADIKQIVAAVANRRPTSATIGDLPMQADIIVQAVQAVATTGVDYIKIGFFSDDWYEVIAALTPLAQQGLRLVAVLFADIKPNMAIIPYLQQAGFYGVMLDTLNKQQGSLPKVMPQLSLQAFVSLAKASGLLCGLAGSLRLDDIPALLALEPDYLGFRGALCTNNARTTNIDIKAIQRIRQVI
jgi:(5-formylfuran-3-yl)methyl phosphate synthase